MRNNRAAISNASCCHSGLDPESRDFSRKPLDSCFRRNDEKSGLNPNSRGVSIIAAIFIIVILAFMGLMFVSLISTGSFSAVNDMQSAQAFYIAEGGVEYILMNRTFPNYSMGGATINLGQGNFSVAPPAYLTGQVNIGDIAVNVNSTTGFAPPPGRIVIDSEVMTYTGMGPGTFTISPAARSHTNGNAVYPVTTVSVDPGLADPTSISVASTTGFAIPGIINIGSENMYCTGTNGTQFLNCTRAYNGTTAAAHAVGSNVFQYAFTSTGSVNPAERVVWADMTPRIRNSGSSLGWSWPPAKDWVLAAFAVKPASGSTIAYDQSAYGTFSKTASPPFQWSHTVGAGATFLYVGLSIGKQVALNPATSVTYGTQGLTRLAALDHSNGNVRVEAWYLQNPLSGAHNVTVTIPAGNDLIGGSASFTGVDQTKTFDGPTNLAYGTGSLANVNVTITTPNAWILDAFCQLKTPNFQPISTPPQNAYPNWGATPPTVQVGGTAGAGSYTNTGLLFPNAANTMKIGWSELFN
jgi:hypothetical protein